MPVIYALLIGINNYPSNALRGCINDVNAVEECLQKIYGSKPYIQLKIRRVTDQDEQPTRENIISAFDFFKDAADNDSCLLYYSGHGSFSKAPEEFWTETDGFLESVVCINSRIPGGRDLMDKEIGYLIASITAEKPSVSFIVITDCCHSGTITRAIPERDIIERSYKADFTPRELKDFYGFGELINGEPAYNVKKTAEGKQLVTVQQGKHIHLAAARDNQTAKELMIEGLQRGAFTYSLLKTLYSTNGQSTYKELIKNVEIQVNNTVADQHPLVNLNGGLPNSELNKYFLSALSGNAAMTYKVYWNKTAGWCINAGSIHGVSVGDEVIIEGVCRTKLVDQYAPDFSVLMNKPQLGERDRTYTATVQINPRKQFSIAFAENIDPVIRQYMENAYKKHPPSLVSVVQEKSARYHIRNIQKEVFISLPGDDLPVFKPIEITNESQAAFFLDRVEIVSTWLHLLELNHPASSISKKDYSLALYRSAEPGDYNDTSFKEVEDINEISDFHYLYKNGKWFQPAMRLKISNTGKNDLWINCLFLSFDYSINSSLLKEIRLPAGQSAWLTYIDSNGIEQNMVRLKLDQKYAVLGYNVITEYLKLFISTDKLDTTAFEQDGVEMPKKRSFQLENFAQKGIGAAEDDKRSVDWTTVAIGLRIVQPEGAVEIIPARNTHVNGITLEAHPSLRATFNITSSQETSRSADHFPAPHMVNRNSFLQPYNLLPGTRTTAGTDVLELFNVADKDCITEEAPLVISLPVDRSEESAPVIPMGYDWQTKLFFPLGYSTDQNKLVIEKLPDETASDAAITQRSLLGSIKIYFQKVVGQKLGLKYDYPRLAIVDVTDDLQVKYNHDENAVQQAVQKANTILLFIHGIIGDTEGMVKCIKTVLDDSGTTLENKTELVLSFDYENLHTPIEENAALLQKRLEAAGLTEGHGKQLNIVAHSMGGLISRWYIEKRGGNKVVNKLIMFGTPNNGTPWADVRDMAETFITYGVNGAAFLQPWMVVLSMVGKLAKGTQVAFKQMDIKTGIYDKLNDGTDPGIPYRIISGNTQNIIARYDETASLITRLMQKFKKKGAYSALDLLLFKKPNDIAVTVESISTLKNADQWSNKTVVENAACDHMSYFITTDALKNILA